MERLVSAIENAKRVYICGNGGSASTANHFANDLMKMCGIRAYSLCSNEAILTAYANDDSFENVFVDQLEVYAEQDDLVITISTSGKSKNLLKVREWSNRMGIALLEFPIWDKSTDISIQIAETLHLQRAHNICEEINEHRRRNR